MSDKSYLLVNELVAACVAFGRQVEPDWQTRIEKAQRELREYIEGLEKDNDRMRLERLADDSGSYDSLIPEGE